MNISTVNIILISSILVLTILAICAIKVNEKIGPTIVTLDKNLNWQQAVEAGNIFNSMFGNNPIMIVKEEEGVN